MRGVRLSSSLYDNFSYLVLINVVDISLIFVFGSVFRRCRVTVAW